MLRELLGHCMPCKYHLPAQFIGQQHQYQIGLHGASFANDVMQACVGRQQVCMCMSHWEADLELHVRRWQGTTPDMTTLYISALDTLYQVRYALSL